MLSCRRPLVQQAEKIVVSHLFLNILETLILPPTQLRIMRRKEATISLGTWGGNYRGNGRNTGFLHMPYGHHQNGIPQQVPAFNMEAVREVVQELYGPRLRQVGRPKFHKPYPHAIDMENPYPRGYRVPNFSLFSGEDGLSTLEHVARFTIQCGELANYPNFNHLKLRLFPNFLTGPAFTWYATLPRDSIHGWQDMERQFHTQFLRAEPEVCVAELSRLTLKGGERADQFIARFKKMRNRCNVYLPEVEYVKMAQRGLNIELRKKFQGMEFRDFYELAAKVTEYEDLLREESHRKKSAMGTYCQKIYHEVAVADLKSTGTHVCPLLHSTGGHDAAKKSFNDKPPQFSFDVSKSDALFDFLLKEKFITLPAGHKLPTKEEIKGKTYCKYHDSWNHATNNCWGFKNAVQERINKGILKFPEKKEAMLVDEDPFPPVVTMNMVAVDMRDVLNRKKEDLRLRLAESKKEKGRSYHTWIPKEYLRGPDELQANIKEQGGQKSKFE
ncbi:uncharacterized protein [Euphorbia lathyris]|uniref:uncharacterized protein n=1 Tax=Euphorbia lathyris TaxID=212925 RepID=UPI0033141E61